MGWEDLGERLKRSKTPGAEDQQEQKKDPTLKEPTIRERALYNRRDYGIFGSKKSKTDPRAPKK